MRPLNGLFARGRIQKGGLEERARSLFAANPSGKE
jgi:hypothetical protein